MDYPDFAQEYLKVTKKQFAHFKNLGDKTFGQLSEIDFHQRAKADNSNSIGMLIQHLHGNMKSRWIDFLQTDGEKASRKRDTEFVPKKLSKAELLVLWEEGWKYLFDALEEVNASNLFDLIFIRGKEHTILQALQNQLGHYASHVGQIIYQAKHLKGSDFETLSIPLGGSEDFFKNAAKGRRLRILVPVDFSEVSKNALAFAIDFAQAVNSRIWVTHVFFPHLNPGVSLADERLQNQVEQARGRLTTFLEKIDHKGIEIEHSIKVGFIVDEILEIEKKKKIDLIIMGNTGIGHGLINSFGSTSAGVAFKSASKVLLVPQKSVFQPPKLLVLANDQSKIKLIQVEAAMQFCEKIGAVLELVHVGKTETKASKSVFENLLHNLALPIKYTLSNQNEGAIIKALNTYAEERNADWIVMVARERSFWKKILRPDGGKEIIGCTDRPLLVMH